LCTFGALEDAFLARDFRRLKTLAVSLALAMLLTQLMIAGGALTLDSIRYLPIQMPWLGIALGGVLFGFGMALVGTCALGSLVRLGSGDLRSFATILVYALTALAILRGSLMPLRLAYVETISIALPGGLQSDLAALASWFTAIDMRLMVTILIAGLLLLWAFSRGELIRAPRLLAAGIVLGIGAAAAWFATGVLADDLLLTTRPEGLTFVAPVADAVQGFAWTEASTWSFGVASVVGVPIGSALASLCHDEFHWEAYDDQREMRRHIAGGAIMGIGGVLAGGCTIGQGITAGSVLALSWPLAVGGMAIGARLGLFLLLEGRPIIDILWPRWLRKRNDKPT